MSQLIKVVESNINNETTKTVNARELHEYLGVGRDFTNWIKKRIEQYNFVENQDFILLAKTGEQDKHGGSNRVDYHISLDMAKELSMVERNEKGKEARQYFIQCEKELRTQAPALPDFSNPVEAARAWADQLEAKLDAIKLAEEQTALVIKAKPKVDHYDAVVEKTGLLNATQVATKVKMSAQKLNKILDDMDVYNKNVSRSRIFKQWFINKDYGITRQTIDGYPQSMFTLKGEAWIIEQLVSEGII